LRSFIEQTRPTTREVRDKHVHDITLTSGEGFASKSWDSSKREQKLRTCARMQCTYARVKASQNERGTRAESDLENNHASPEAPKELEIVNAKLKYLDRMVLHIDRLNSMVLDELDPDWDWKTEIPAQLKVVNEEVVRPESWDLGDS
jgi:hypothetical protein